MIIYAIIGNNIFFKRKTKMKNVLFPITIIFILFIGFSSCDFLLPEVEYRGLW